MLTVNEISPLLRDTGFFGLEMRKPVTVAMVRSHLEVVQEDQESSSEIDCEGWDLPRSSKKSIGFQFEL